MISGSQLTSSSTAGPRTQPTISSTHCSTHPTIFRHSVQHSSDQPEYNPRNECGHNPETNHNSFLDSIFGNFQSLDILMASLEYFHDPNQTYYDKNDFESKDTHAHGDLVILEGEMNIAGNEHYRGMVQEIVPLLYMRSLGILDVCLTEDFET